MRYLTALAATLLLTSCKNTLPPEPKYYVKHDPNSMFIDYGPSFDTISVSMFVANTPKTNKPKTVLDLSDKGQAAFIEKLDDNAVLATALATPISLKPKSAKDDLSVFSQKRRFTFTITTSRMQPADRIIEAHLIATLPDNWTFSGWSGLSVVESDIKVANVVNALTNRAKATVGLGLDKFIEELLSTSVEQERTNTSTVTSDLTFDVIELLPRLTDKTAEFILKAPFPQVNLTGSYTVDVSLKYEGTKFIVKNIVPFSENDEKGITFKRKGILPLQTGNLDYEMPYVVRRVTGSSALTLKEGDDQAIYQYVNKQADSENEAAKISDRHPYGKAKLEIQSNIPRISALMLKGEPVTIRFNKNISRVPVCFIHQDGGELNKLLSWIKKERPKRIQAKDSNGDLLWALLKDDSSKLLAPSDLDALTIQRFALQPGDDLFDEFKPINEAHCKTSFVTAE